jgi:hypothetical protein
MMRAATIWGVRDALGKAPTTTVPDAARPLTKSCDPDDIQQYVNTY